MNADDITLLTDNPRAAIRLYWDLGFEAAAHIIAKETGLCIWCALAPLKPGDHCQECGEWGDAEGC